VKAKTAFISGHGDLSQGEFTAIYVPWIDAAIRDGITHFVVGDFKGSDFFAQIYLTGKNVVVYHMFNSPRHNAGQFPTIGGFSDDESRDTAMTEASCMDIAWVRPGKEKSGTALNLARRKK
jgi:hypothetical protein